ncbi:hypothetical protein BS47DRAFT_1345830, partial [Hydnum rufescens UP504]
MRNSGLSLLVIWLGLGLTYSGMMVSVVSMVFSLLVMLTSTDAPFIEMPMERAYDTIDTVPISEAKKPNLSLRVGV